MVGFKEEATGELLVVNAGFCGNYLGSRAAAWGSARPVGKLQLTPNDNARCKAFPFSLQALVTTEANRSIDCNGETQFTAQIEEVDKLRPIIVSPQTDAGNMSDIFTLP